MSAERPPITPELCAEVALLARRAGLDLDATEVESLAIPYGMLQADLVALHAHRFDDTVEPSLTFDARPVSRP